MKSVTRDQFYASIGQLNVHPYPTGKYPYTTDWKTPQGQIIGKTVPEIGTHPHLFTNHFFVDDSIEIKNITEKTLTQSKTTTSPFD